MDKDNMNTEIEETTELFNETDDTAYDEVDAAAADTFMMDEEPEPPKPKKKFKFKKWMIIPIVLVVLYIASKVLFGGGNAAVMPIETTPAITTDITQQFSGSGKLDSAETDTIYLPTDFASATVKEVTAKVGDTVTAGQVLATLDTTDLAYNVTQTENAYKQVWLSNQDAFGSADEYNARVNELNALKNDLATANADLTNWEGTESYYITQLKPVEANISKMRSQLATLPADDPSRPALEQELAAEEQNWANLMLSKDEATNKIAWCKDVIANNPARIVAKEAEVLALKPYYLTQAQRVALVNNEEAARKAWENAKEAYAAASKGIVAPNDGLLTSFSAEKGATVTGGMQVGKVGSMTDVEVALPLSKFELEILEVGQPATITVGDKEYTGSVDRINHSTAIGAATDLPTATGSSSSNYINAYVKLDNPPSNIFLGLEANVVVITASKTNILAVPTTAVITDIDGTYCYVMEGEEMVQKFVETGISNEMLIEIVSGLEEGDEVVANPGLMNSGGQTGGMVMFG